MIVLWAVFLSFFADVCKSAKTTQSPGISWDFNQTDYDVKMERMEVTRYNHLYMKNPKAAFVPYNRTQRAVNMSVELLIDILPDGFKLDAQVYKFRSNEYRFFPITVTVNPCVEYERNSLHAQEIFAKTSNISGCPLRKGFYAMTNGLPDFTKFPPLLPRGQYKVNTNWTYKMEFVMELDAYASVNDKPMKWNK